MQNMGRIAAAGMLVLTLGLTGCGGQQAAAGGCAPLEGGVAVCLNGQAVTWSPGALPPHMHENGGYYGPVVDLQKALGVKAEVAPDKARVTVNGKQVLAMAQNAKGIHNHDALVYAPIKEFAEAAGFRVQVDTKNNVVNITK